MYIKLKKNPFFTTPLPERRGDLFLQSPNFLFPIYSFPRSKNDELSKGRESAKYRYKQLKKKEIDVKIRALITA